MKRILFDVGHPAQVHNFKHVYWKLQEKGWQGLFTAKDKEVTIALLEAYKLPYIVIGKTNKGLLKKIFGLFFIFFRFLTILFKFKPNLIVCRFSPHACWGAWLMRIPLIGLADTEHTTKLDALTVPLANVKLTAYSYQRDLGQNHLRFKGNIELFYLHPNQFKTSSIKIANSKDANTVKEYALLRFVSWEAHHDIGHKGLSNKDKMDLVSLLQNHFQVLISSEGNLPVVLNKYKIKISPEEMHQVLSNASIYVGEGASMASEAAVLGIPSVYVNSLNAGSLEEQEKFGLLFNFRKGQEGIKKVKELLKTPNLKEEFKIKKEKMLSEQIDPSAFLVWFIDSYPASVMIMKENPNYQYNFR